MFSFHKPKIYRSISGCCICRAKSSSSRFTDSKKYETEFEKCFRIGEKRTGEICNACVLLVKRWKKLPIGTNRNWHHVVDARAGPGTKSFKNKPQVNSSGPDLKKHRFGKNANRNNSLVESKGKKSQIFPILYKHSRLLSHNAIWRTNCTPPLELFPVSSFD